MKFNWTQIYILLRITTINTYLIRMLNDILFLNKKFVFLKKNTPLCSFCNKEEDAPLLIFSECTSVIYLRQQLALLLKTIWLYQYIFTYLWLFRHWKATQTINRNEKKFVSSLNSEQNKRLSNERKKSIFESISIAGACRRLFKPCHQAPLNAK